MFMEAQLYYFGAHTYDLKSEGTGEVEKGKILGSGMRTTCTDIHVSLTHHYEWKPA